MNYFTPKGLAMVVPGSLLAGYALIKLFVIGFYPREILPTLLILAAGSVLVWAAGRFGRTPPRPSRVGEQARP